MVDKQKPAEESAAEIDQLRKTALVGFLREQIGKPFRYGEQTGGNAVFDCSSLVQKAYATVGLGIARTAINQATYFGRPVETQEDLQIGDLLFFGGDTGYYNPQYPQGDGIGHVATYIGDNMVIHTMAWAENGEEFGEVVEETVAEALKRRADLVGKEDDLVVVKRVLERDVYYHEGQAKPLPESIGRVE